MFSENARLRLLLIAPVLALLATVSFETTRRWTVSSTVQESIEAAAEAAAENVADVPAAIAAAKASAREARDSGMVVLLRDGDVEFGHVVAGAFRPMTADFHDATAIRVTTTHSYRTVLAPIWGVNEWSVTRSTVREVATLQANRS